MNNFSPFQLKIKKIEENKEQEKKQEQEKWFKKDGELAVDIYQTETSLIIQAAIAGVKPEDLDIAIEKDVVTIKGNREEPLNISEKKDYFTQECYWGSFSRKIILPVEVDPDDAEASMKQGILIIELPKISQEKIKIEVK